MTGRRSRSATAAQSTAPSESAACCPKRTRSGLSRSSAFASARLVATRSEPASASSATMHGPVGADRERLAQRVGAPSEAPSSRATTSPSPLSSPSRRPPRARECRTRSASPARCGRAGRSADRSASAPQHRELPSRRPRFSRRADPNDSSVAIVLPKALLRFRASRANRSMLETPPDDSPRSSVPPFDGGLRRDGAGRDDRARHDRVPRRRQRHLHRRLRRAQARGQPPGERHHGRSATSRRSHSSRQGRRSMSARAWAPACSTSTARAG